MALTRATMRASTFLRFWRRVPDISAVIGQDPNVIFKIGIGEVPLLHQITFSIWPDAASMAHFARGDGPHGRAIRRCGPRAGFPKLYAGSGLRMMGTSGGLVRLPEGRCMSQPFPFSAIVGQAEMKHAMVLTAIDPGIGGVLVFGDRGTGKSTAVRALAALLPEIAAVEGCPVNSARVQDVPEWAGVNRAR